ncbi:MAG: hypothetical protein PHU32_04590 [Candidatus ainarchaeum sp.]|jgi:hypothetical protein|nr:hypothetical protein [Candidatus ainarchaeum sp.]
MDSKQFNPEDIKKDIEVLMDKISDENTPEEEKLAYMKLLNALLEFNTEFIKEVKREYDMKKVKEEINKDSE